MGYYSTIEGWLQFEDAETAQEATKEIKPWFDDSEGVRLNKSKILIDGYFRNLGRNLISIKKMAEEYHIVETTTDGAFEGYLHMCPPDIQDTEYGKYDVSVIVIDLDDWGEDEVGSPPEDLDSYCDWQSSVESMFLDSHAGKVT